MRGEYGASGTSFYTTTEKEDYYDTLEAVLDKKCAGTIASLCCALPTQSPQSLCSDLDRHCEHGQGGLRPAMQREPAEELCAQARRRRRAFDTVGELSETRWAISARLSCAELAQWVKPTAEQAHGVPAVVVALTSTACMLTAQTR